MLKKGLQVTLLTLLFVGCAGTIRMAEEEERTPNQTRVTKPSQMELNHTSQTKATQNRN